MAGGVAGIVGTTIIYPIDICKTRIQASHQAGFWSKYPSDYISNIFIW